MKKFTILVLVTLVIFLSVPCLFASGTYFIGKDDQGIYMETSDDGFWRFDAEYARQLTPGTEGRYTVGTDAEGTYIRTDRFGRFYFDGDDYEETGQEIEDFNSEQQRLAKAKETEVIISGNQVLVPVVIGFGDRRTEARLLLDTGASATMLHREIAKKLGIEQMAHGQAIVADGKSVPTEVTKLSYVQVGPYKKKGMYVHIIDHDNSSSSHEGLLGMDFLRNLKFHVDFENKVIRWQE